jgi:hypothetical protein
MPLETPKPFSRNEFRQKCLPILQEFRSLAINTRAIQLLQHRLSERNISLDDVPQLLRAFFAGAGSRIDEVVINRWFPATSSPHRDATPRLSPLDSTSTTRCSL